MRKMTSRKLLMKGEIQLDCCVIFCDFYGNVPQQSFDFLFVAETAPPPFPLLYGMGSSATATNGRGSLRYVPSP
jgi:hypothetical protein